MPAPQGKNTVNLFAWTESELREEIARVEGEIRVCSGDVPHRLKSYHRRLMRASVSRKGQ